MGKWLTRESNSLGNSALESAKLWYLKFCEKEPTWNWQFFALFKFLGDSRVKFYTQSYPQDVNKVIHSPFVGQIFVVLKLFGPHTYKILHLSPSTEVCIIVFVGSGSSDGHRLRKLSLIVLN